MIRPRHVCGFITGATGSQNVGVLPPACAAMGCTGVFYSKQKPPCSTFAPHPLYDPEAHATYRSELSVPSLPLESRAMVPALTSAREKVNAILTDWGIPLTESRGLKTLSAVSAESCQSR